jgi:hypothetical protein
LAGISTPVKSLMSKHRSFRLTPTPNDDSIGEPSWNARTKYTEAVAVLCCLTVHVCLWVRWEYFVAQTDWLDGIDAFLMVTGTLIGLPCGILALRRGPAVVRAVGFVGVVYFAYYILLAIAES